MDNIIFSTGSYQLTKTDNFNASLYSILWYFKSFKAMSGPILIGFLIGSGQGLYYNSIGIFLLVMFGSAFIYCLIIVIFSVMASLIFNKSNLNISFTLNITESSLVVFGENNTTTFTWKNLESVKQSKSLLFIISNNKIAYIIPKRIFANEDLKDQFVTTVEQLISKAKDK